MHYVVRYNLADGKRSQTGQKFGSKSKAKEYAARENKLGRGNANARVVKITRIPKRDRLTVGKNVCSNCGKVIRGSYKLAGKRFYHLRCEPFAKRI